MNTGFILRTLHGYFTFHDCIRNEFVEGCSCSLDKSCINTPPTEDSRLRYKTLSSVLPRLELHVPWPLLVTRKSPPSLYLMPVLKGFLRRLPTGHPRSGT
uniref:Uncharacterized protein n=1 Tax=Opuntia streptacantha TaxID=393608 RepID=A0A7C9A3E8_OPUST